MTITYSRATYILGIGTVITVSHIYVNCPQVLDKGGSCMSDVVAEYVEWVKSNPQNWHKLFGEDVPYLDLTALDALSK
jgi:hypothetical protein